MSIFGHTAPKVKDTVRRATGGVLFIDEAYSLAPSSRKDFGHECISTLIAEMENNRNNLCVILAGYPKQMEELLESNPRF